LSIDEYHFSQPHSIWMAEDEEIAAPEGHDDRGS